MSTEPLLNIGCFTAAYLHDFYVAKDLHVKTCSIYYSVKYRLKMKLDSL
jgi:hypothetical protein